MTLGELQRRLRALLTEALPAGEAEGCVRAILEDAGGYTPVDLALRGDVALEAFTAERLLGMARRVAAGEPVQYVTGHARFYGMDLHVEPGVLVPRAVNVTSTTRRGAPTCACWTCARAAAA